MISSSDSHVYGIQLVIGLVRRSLTVTEQILLHFCFRTNLFDYIRLHIQYEYVPQYRGRPNEC